LRFFIIDDDVSIRSMLSHIIEDEELGEIVGEAEDGAEVNTELLDLKKVDILLIDLLMPVRDGIETVKKIKPFFNGKVIMISQVESKDLIGQAYTYGIDHYITKPINKIEVLSVLKNVLDHIRLEKSIQDIQRSLHNAMNIGSPKPYAAPHKERSFSATGRFLLSELGIAGESGNKDFMEIMQFFYDCEQKQTSAPKFPSIKEIFKEIALKKLGESPSEADLNREMKASEQRVRRAIYHSLNSLASLGLTDFSHPKFENYSSKFFDFNTVRQKMEELKGKKTTTIEPIRINTKKFIHVLYFEIQQLMEE
jgi:two-component system, response regulator YcbB